MMIERIQRLRKGDQGGVVLISAIILMVVGSILAASVLAMSVSEAKQVEYGLEQTQAQAYARSAVNVVVASVKNDLYELHDQYAVIVELDQRYAAFNKEYEEAWIRDDKEAMSDLVFQMDQITLEIEPRIEYYESDLRKFESYYFRTQEKQYGIKGLMHDRANEEILVKLLGNISGYEGFDELSQTTISVPGMYSGTMPTVSEAQLNLVLAKPSQYIVSNSVYEPQFVGGSGTEKVESGVYHTFDRAVIAYNKFNMYNSVSISGTIDYYGEKNTYDPPTIRHVDTAANPADYAPIYSNTNQLLSTLQYHLGSSNIIERGNGSFTNGRTISPADSGQYGTLNMSGAIEVNTQNNDVVLYANSLAFAAGTSITVTGPNELIILLDDNGKSEPVINATNGVHIKNKEGSRPLTKIYVAKTNNGSPQIRFGGGDSEVEAYIYAPDHDIIINHDVDTIGKYKGAMVGYNVSVSRASVSYTASGRRFLCTEFKEGTVPEGGPGSPSNPSIPGDGGSSSEPKDDDQKTFNVKYYPYDEMTLTWIR